MNECEDCDRTDCCERSCIAPVNKPVNKLEDTEEAYLRTIIRDLLAVMPVFPEGAKAIIGLEDKYNMAVRMAREAVRYKR